MYDPGRKGFRRQNVKIFGILVTLNISLYLFHYFRMKLGQNVEKTEAILWWYFEKCMYFPG